METDPIQDNIDNNRDDNLLNPAQVELLVAQRIADAIVQHDAARAAEKAKRKGEDQGKPLT